MSSLVISNKNTFSTNSPKSFDDVNLCFKRMKIGLISNSSYSKNPLMTQNETPIKFLKGIFPFIDESRIIEVLQLTNNNVEQAKNLLLEIDLNCNEEVSCETKSIITRSKRTLSELRNCNFQNSPNDWDYPSENVRVEDDIKNEINKIKTSISGNTVDDKWFDQRHPEYKKYLISKCIQSLIKSKII